MENNPTIRPGVESSYSHGWQQLKRYFLEMLAIVFIEMLISLPSSITQTTNKWVIPFLGFFTVIYSILIQGPVGFGVSFSFLKAARGDKVEIMDMFAAFKNYLNAVVASLLVGIIIMAGLILFIVPGIIFACKLAFAPYLVVDRKMDAVAAIKESWRMTDGYAGTVFLIGLLAIPIMLAGLLIFGVGILVSIIWVSMAMASLYHSVSTRQSAP